jgi:SAM-dependent methyltransferase
VSVRVAPEWLALRERADAAARSRELVELLRTTLPRSSDGTVIHDLGCGSGSMARWLAPLLDGPQHWVAHDRDENLLAIAVANPPTGATVQARTTDLGRMRPADLAGASLITASALLDILTEDEMSALARVCLAAGCPILVTLSVLGEVEITPPNPLDGALAAAFNAHQRRVTDRGRLLGPDAVSFAVDTFGRHGREVVVRTSPWRLRPADAGLIAEWFRGWVAAACEQEPGLVTNSGPYVVGRCAQLAAGELAVTVGHADFLVLP